MLTIGDKFPAFDLKAVVSTDPKKAFTAINDTSDEGKWKIIFFWPKDFTFVCPTEIAAFGKLNGEFNDRMPWSTASPPTASSCTWRGGRTMPT
jgi:peroxiredoxin (alkyl hydroperoxide reductase subunit C)